MLLKTVFLIKELTIPKNTPNHFFLFFALGACKPSCIGTGCWKRSVQLPISKKHPNYNFIAVDIKSDRLYISAKQALEEKVNNIAFVRMNLQELAKVFSKNSVATIWLTFPDPYPRKRSVRRRLTHPLFLNQYQRLLKKNGQLKFKTDNRELFLWSLEQFIAQNWQIKELSFDLHESGLPEDYKIRTHYEQKFLNAGSTINYCALLK